LSQTQKIEAIGTLAGGIAHDFNNILMGIFGNISLAKLKIPKNSPGFKNLEESEKSLERAKHLTSQLLTFSTGGEPITDSICITRLVDEVTNFDLSGSNVKPVFKYSKALWQAKADKGQIQQVFSNLVINAVHAMPDGGSLYITLKSADIAENEFPGLNQGKYIKCTVMDEGIGIDSKHLERIFDPFFSNKDTGRGLGLATVYSIIKKHGGSISTDSAIGKGTTFTLYLPASDTQQNSKIKQPEVSEDSIIDQTAKILVIDDEEKICKFLTELLVEYRFTVSTAPDGKQGLAMYKQSMKDGKSFDIVIMDLTIPGGIGGKEAINDLLKIDPKAKCIVSSGYANDPVMANYSYYGFKSVITKPYTPKKLLEVLSLVLEE